MSLPLAWIRQLEDELQQWERYRAAWQGVDLGRLHIANDHSDRSYDEEVLSKLLIVALRSARLIAALVKPDDEDDPQGAVATTPASGGCPLVSYAQTPPF